MNTLTITVKPFPELRNSQMMFVGVVTRSHRTAVATTLLLPTSAACRAAAAELVDTIEATSKLTSKELQVLKAIDASEYGDYLTDTIWSFSVAQNSNLKPTSIGGIVASLQKKGFVICGEARRDDDATVGITQAGAAVYVAAVGRAKKPLRSEADQTPPLSHVCGGLVDSQGREVEPADSESETYEDAQHEANAAKTAEPVAIEPHGLFKVWSPDEVAECIDGITAAGLYAPLWELVPVSEKPPNGFGDDFSDYCLAKAWGKLTADQQMKLNELAKKHEAKEV